MRAVIRYYGFVGPIRPYSFIHLKYASKRNLNHVWSRPSNVSASNGVLLLGCMFAQLFPPSYPETECLGCSVDLIRPLSIPYKAPFPTPSPPLVGPLGQPPKHPSSGARTDVDVMHRDDFQLSFSLVSFFCSRILGRPPHGYRKDLGTIPELIRRPN